MDHGLGGPRNKNGENEDNINISDVIEVIQTTDPDFNQSGMFSGGGEISANTAGQRTNTVGSSGSHRRGGAYIKILEQPASKALRFRYECEGRSAGSIPGASSTPENKTFPAIQVVGYQGRAVVVVSCVTKDPPYRPHPHNLVGREGCRRGVCTLEVSPETMAVTFSNLGIQCVKKKDIEDALKVREEIRVDPFRTGFSHRNQPTSIDLNAVRLCFQVFLEGDNRGKFTVPLSPVVSDPIYDKKAMSDLVICKLSDCSCTVAGGKEIILLCEKVAKEDIQVRFYEESNGNIIWEGVGDFQPSHVHKQVAISFRTPRYRSLEVPEPVKVFIQLRRPSDGATSESLPFEFLPLDSGRPAFWSLRRSLQKKGDLNTFNSILAADRFSICNNKYKKIKPNGSLFQNQNKIEEIEIIESPTTSNSTQLIETNFDDVEIDKNNVETPIIIDVTSTLNNNNNNKDWCDYSEVEKITIEQPKETNNNNNNEEKSLNDLLNQVAELDEIYSDTRARLLDITQLNSDEIIEQSMDIDQNFDDSNTYSSLQLAFKNPIEIELPLPLPPPHDVIRAQGPVIEIAPLKREIDNEKLPPLPPKRIRKSIETPVYLGRSHSQNSLQLSQADDLQIIGNRSNSIHIISRPKSQEMLAPAKELPPTPNSTLPNPKKKNFFSKLFAKKDKKNSMTSLNADTATSASLTGGSLCNISSSNDELQAASQQNDLIKCQNELNAASNKFNGSLKDVDILNLDLTDAEHYALYTAMAPHATQSEFDEISCYYSPVEGGKVLKSNQTDKLKNT